VCLDLVSLLYNVVGSLDQIDRDKMRL
jgi:hypothetical protein